MVLVDKLNKRESPDWYAAAAVEYGWSRNVLMNMIMGQAMEGTGSAPQKRCQPRIPS